MQNMTIYGVIIGLLFAIAVASGGFGGFLWAIFFGAVFGIGGAHLEGRIDLKAIADNLLSSRGGRG